MGSTPRKSVFFATQGTRGDVQPYVHLGEYLARRGWAVAVGSAPEFASLVEGHGLKHINLGPSPAFMYRRCCDDGPAGLGRARTRLGKALAANAIAADIFNPPPGAGRPPFAEPWFRGTLAACRALRPDVLVLVFTAWAGAAAIPALLGLPTRVVLSYPMPMTPTREFGVTMAGRGFSEWWGPLNRLAWAAAEAAVVGGVHAPAARRIVATVAAEEAAAGRPLPGAGAPALDDRLGIGAVPALYLYSAAWLPKPADWPANHHVCGAISEGEGAAPRPLPRRLQEYLDAADEDGIPIVSIGLGSLGFFPAEQAAAVLGAAAAAVAALACRRPVRAVIQTAASSVPGQAPLALGAAAAGAPVLAFDETVDHGALFRRVALVVCHGGVGTVTAALRAGRPVMSVCCLPSADQSFWADLAWRRGLGPRWQWASAATPASLEAALDEGLGPRHAEFARAAAAMGAAMDAERGASVAEAMLEGQVLEARKAARGGAPMSARAG